jgi:hypothetical protein
MEFLIVILLLIALDAAAMRWGRDSRDGFTRHYGNRRFRF